MFYKQANGYIFNCFFLINDLCSEIYLILEKLFWQQTFRKMLVLLILFEAALAKNLLLMFLKSNTMGKIEMVIELIHTWDLKSNKKNKFTVSLISRWKSLDWKK